MQKRDLVARISGLLTFILGIAFLIVSFVIAFKLFTSPSAGLAITSAHAAGSSTTSNLGQSALEMVIRIGSLFIMVLAGSFISARGIQMYFAANHQPKTEE